MAVPAEFDPAAEPFLDGVYGGSEDLIYVDAAGGVRWTIPGGAQLGAQFVVGDRLFLDNRESQIIDIDIDPASGTERRRLTALPGAVVGDWEIVDKQGLLQAAPTR